MSVAHYHCTLFQIWAAETWTSAGIFADVTMLPSLHLFNLVSNLNSCFTCLIS